MNTIRTQIVKIGNSRGIRIPRVLIEAIGLERDVEISVQSDQLVIRPISRPRHNWEERFRAMAERGDDQFLDAPALTQCDRDEWEW